MRCCCSVLWVVFVTTAIAGCDSVSEVRAAPGSAAPGSAAPGSAAIAVLNDTTGNQAPLGIEATAGAVFALGAGACTTSDTASSPEVAAAMGREAAAHHAIGVGFTDSDTALAGVAPFTASGKPFVIIGATDPTLPSRCGLGTFLACFGDDAQARAAADFGAGQFGKRVAIIFDSRRDYTLTLAGFFRGRIGERTGTVVVEIDLATAQSARIAELLAPARPSIDFVYAALQPEQVAGVLAAVRSALPRTPIIGGDGLDFAGVLTTAGAATDRVWFTTHAWLGDGASEDARTFASAFKSATGREPTAFAALGYDAARLAEDARGRAGSDDPTRIAAALAATRDFHGVTGTISFAKGPVPVKDVWIIEIAQGSARLAKRWVPRP